MHKVFAVVRREFLERVRTRAFLIGTFIFPLLLVGFWALPLLLTGRDTGPRRVAVVDATTNGVGERVTRALEAAKTGGKESHPRFDVVRIAAADRAVAVRDSLIARTAVRRSVAKDALDGVLVVTDANLEAGAAEYYGGNVGSLRDMNVLEALVERTVQRGRFLAVGIDSVTVARAGARVELKTSKVADGKLSGESGGSSFALAYAMNFILYLTLLLYGVQVMSSIVEEKSNRVSEVMISSLRPFQMMLGKVLGVGSVGLLQVAIWTGTAAILTTYGLELAKVMGFSDGGAGISLPRITPDLLIVFLTFFVLGFLGYSAMYAAVGAMCNSTQETQQANTPVTMVIMAGFICMFALLNDPNGTLGQVLSFIPLISSFVVPIRYSLSPMPWWEVLAAAAMSLVGLFAVTWVASRIYRVGILSYGKRPNLAELIQWVRTA